LNETKSWAPAAIPRILYNQLSERPAEATMVKVSVMYPMQQGTEFDMTYYVNRHIPMVRQLLGPSLKGVSVEQGISGMQPGSSATYVAMGHLLFDSVTDFQASFGPHAETIIADIPKYTNSEPTIQISEVKL
jgi:uncharacterized protein (TIGR02118 family)